MITHHKFKNERSRLTKYCFQVTADSNTFLKGAETLELLKRIHPDRGDGMKPFNRNEVRLFTFSVPRPR